MAHNRLVRELRIRRLELDEMHSYVHMRQMHLRPDDPTNCGEQWLYLAVGSTSKLIVSYRVGRRNEVNTDAFVRDLRGRLLTVPALNSDAMQA